MSYAIMEELEVGEGFANRLRAILSHDHAARIAEQQEDARNVLFLSLAAHGKVRKDLVEQRIEALARAEEAARAYKIAEHAANAAESFMKKHAAAAQALQNAAANAFAAADAERERLLVPAKETEAIASILVAECKKLIPDPWVAHIPEMYTAQIEALCLMAEAQQSTPLARLALGDNVKRIRVSLSGHVEFHVYENGQPLPLNIRTGERRGFFNVSLHPIG
jgi:hypothetical protein